MLYVMWLYDIEPGEMSTGGRERRKDMVGGGGRSSEVMCIGCIICVVPVSTAKDR